MLFGQSDVRADVSKSTNFVRKLLGCVDTFSETKGASVVVEKHLVFASKALVYGRDSRVLLVEPSALDISLFLRIKRFGVNFTNQVGDFLVSLHFFRSWMTTS